MNDKFDAHMFRQAAATMAQSMTQHGTEQAREQARQQKIVEDVRSQIDTASTILCDDCQHHIFVNSVVLKRLSALMSPTGEEMTVPVQVFSCAKCGGVNKEFLPAYAIGDVKKTDENGIPTY